MPVQMMVGVVAAMVASAGHATINLDLMMSMDGGATWSSGAIFPLPGSTVKIAIFASGDLGYGFAGATLRLRGTGRNSGDTIAFEQGTSTGRVSPFNFGAATNAIFHDSATDFRIDAASDQSNSGASAGLSFFQRDPATAGPGTFSASNPVMVFALTYTFGPFGRSQDTVLRLDQLDSAWYFESSSSSRRTQATDVRLGGGVVFVMPAPGSLAALGVGLAWGRRRRGR